VWQHRATGETITIGHDCADKFELLTDRRELDAYRERMAQVRKMGRARADRRKALREFVKGASKELRVALRLGRGVDTRKVKNITADIRQRLICNAAKYGAKLSIKQEELVLRLYAQATEKAARPVEVNVPAPVIEGKRVTIIGDVVSIKTYEGDFGCSEKITVKVKTEAGVWLAWGTASRELLAEGAEIGGIRGCRVQFDAVLKAGREPHFALFSRPTKAKILAGGEMQRRRLEELRKDLETLPQITGQRHSEWKTSTQATIAKIEALLA